MHPFTRHRAPSLSQIIPLAPIDNAFRRLSRVSTQDTMKITVPFAELESESVEGVIRCFSAIARGVNPLFVPNPYLKPGNLSYEKFQACLGDIPKQATLGLVYHGTPSCNALPICENGLDPCKFAAFYNFTSNVHRPHFFCYKPNEIVKRMGRESTFLLTRISPENLATGARFWCSSWYCQANSAVILRLSLLKTTPISSQSEL